jgi:hypothetical protein
MALGSPHPVTEMSNRGKGGRYVRLKPLPLSCADFLEILAAPTSWSPKGVSRPVMR